MTEIDRGAGRPRDERRDRELIEAAQQLLAEVGYDRLTMEAVAARVGAGKATVYRRWTSKVELVIDAVRSLEWTSPPPDTGALRSDLLALGEAFMARDALRDAVQAGLLTAATRDDSIRTAMFEVVGRPRQQAFAAIVANAHARGEVPRLERWRDVSEVFPAMTFHRLVVRKQPIDADYVIRLVDEYIIPLLTRD